MGVKFLSENTYEMATALPQTPSCVCSELLELFFQVFPLFTMFSTVDVESK